MNSISDAYHRPMAEAREHWGLQQLLLIRTVFLLISRKFRNGNAASSQARILEREARETLVKPWKEN
jgi:hypothetical protein